MVLTGGPRTMRSTACTTVPSTGRTAATLPAHRLGPASRIEW